MSISTHILSFVAGALLLAGFAAATPVHSSMHQHSADGNAHTMMVCEGPCADDALAAFDCLAHCLKAATEGREGIATPAPLMPTALLSGGLIVSTTTTRVRTVATRYLPYSQGFDHLSLQRRE